MFAKEREVNLKDFRKGDTRVLITTDLLPPIDFYTVPLIINYDMPMNVENYICRIGKSECVESTYVVINFVCDNEEQKLNEILTFYNTKIEELPVEVGNILYQN